jgi:hypothetical protein
VTQPKPTEDEYVPPLWVVVCLPLALVGAALLGKGGGL